MNARGESPRAFRAQICHGAPVSDPASSLSGRRTLLVMVVIVAIAAVPAVVVPMVLLREKPPHLDDYGVIPAFSLVDERGQAFTEQALHGKATIVSFLFTRCDLECPVTSMKMANIQDKVLLDDGVKLLSITVDPAYDTPERLAAYAAKFHADPTKWRFVTGAPDAVMALIRRGFMLYTAPDGTLQKNGAPSIAHRGDFFLLDGDLHLRGTFEHNDITRIDALIRAARYLARTAN